MDALRVLALSYPEAEEGISCPGTALETPTVQVRKKAFRFLGKDHVRLKLRESLPEAVACAGCEAGSHGWVKVDAAGADALREALMRWVEESYRTLAPRMLAAAQRAGAAGG